MSKCPGCGGKATVIAFGIKVCVECQEGARFSKKEVEKHMKKEESRCGGAFARNKYEEMLLELLTLTFMDDGVLIAEPDEIADDPRLLALEIFN